MKRKLSFLLALVVIVSIATSQVFARTYTVKEGDVLWKIANELGVTVDELKEVNNISNPNLIYPGQVINTKEETNTSDNGSAKYVFMFIGDGLGSSQRQFAEYFLQEQTGDSSKELLMNTFDVGGINTTYSADTLITDSAAAGTALATGHKTNNGIIAQDVNGNNIKTLIECAEEAGMSTGIITTTRLTHATPAAFASHNIHRDNENEIAVDYLDSGVDFIAGGGIRHFIPSDMTGTDALNGSFKSKRKDERNVLDEFSTLGYDVYLGMDGAKNFRNNTFEDSDKVIAAFTYSHMPYEIDRINMYPEVPSLAEITDKGIDVLSKDEDGFFMMVEGGRIDHASHANDAPATIHDVLAFDKAIEEAYEFYLAHPNDTLILVVGDHETGGLGLGMDTQGYFLNIKELLDVKVSVEDTMMYGAGVYTGDQDAYLAYLEENFGLDNLTETELAKLKKGMEDADAGVTYGYYGYNSAAMAATHVLSERANINWTTTIHTGTAIPMTAMGYKANSFGGYKDNTEIAKTMADVLGFQLSE